MINEAIRAAGRRVRDANMAKRRSLAKKFGVPTSDFMPKKIRQTMTRLNIPKSAVPARLIPSIDDPFPGVDMGGSRADIPLSVIPARRAGVKRSFTEETKHRAVAMIGERSYAEVAQEFDVSENQLRNWIRLYDPTASLRLEIEKTKQQRRLRLEQAALIVEIEGTRGAEIAMRIRDLIQSHPSQKFLSRFENNTLRGKPRK